jgi:hypothetical protein
MWPRRRQLAADPAAPVGPGASDGPHDERLALAERRVGELPSDPSRRLQYAAALVESRPKQAAVEALTAVDLDQSGQPMILLGAAIVLVGAQQPDSARACAARAAESAPTEGARRSLERLREKIDQIESVEQRTGREPARGSLSPSGTFPTTSERWAPTASEPARGVR